MNNNRDIMNNKHISFSGEVIVSVSVCDSDRRTVRQTERGWLCLCVYSCYSCYSSVTLGMNDFVWGLKNGDLDQVIENVEKVRLLMLHCYCFSCSSLVSNFPSFLLPFGNVFLFLLFYTFPSLFSSWYCFSSIIFLLSTCFFSLFLL